MSELLNPDARIMQHPSFEFERMKVQNRHKKALITVKKKGRDGGTTAGQGRRTNSDHQSELYYVMRC